MTAQPLITGVDTPAHSVPVSSAQRGLWLINELHPNSSVYNVFCSVRLTGPLDLAALHRALEQVVARHEALRTTFRAGGDGPRQHIAADVAVPLPMTDLSGVSAEHHAARASDQVDAWAEEPFDLAAGPLVKAVVVRLDAQDHLFGLALHHIVCDGQSVHMLFDELARLYAADNELPPLPVQYRDYAAWQRAQVADADRIACAAYW